MLKTILALAWVCVCSFSLHLAMAQQPQAPAQQAQTPTQQAAAAGAEPEAPRVVLQAETTASVLRLMKFSGALRDRAGNARTGAVGLTFALYKEQQGGSPLWLEVHNAQLDDQGRYTVLLGSTKSEGLPLELFSTGEARWLGVQLNLPGEEEQARVLLVSVPYALKAADAETLGGKPPSAFLLAEPVGADPRVRPEAGKEAAKEGPRQENVVGTITGEGTVNMVSKFTGANTIGDGSLFDNGFVGVGNTNPFGKLTVTHPLSGSVTKALLLESHYDLNSGAKIVFDSLSNNGERASIGYSIVSGGGGELFFNTSQQGGFPAAERLRITNTGSVGIGSSNPFGKLTVTNPVAGSVSKGLLLESHYDLNSGSKIVFDSLSNNGERASIGYSIVSGGGGDLLFNTSPQGGFPVSERMRITSTGNVGVGTATPAAKLDVTGNVQASGNVTGSQVVSTTPGGTPPLVVSSATKVTLLNADSLDGLDSAAFAPASGSANYVAKSGDTMVGTLTAPSFVAGGAISAGSASVSGDLAVDSATLFVDSVNNRVGIGTTGPSATLNIFGAGTTSGSLALRVVNGVGEEALSVRDDRRVGINTSAPQAALTVEGVQPATSSGTGTNPPLGLSVTGAKGGNTSGVGFLAGNGGGVSIATGDGGDAPSGSTNGNGGSIDLTPGHGGIGAGSPGSTGNIRLAPGGAASGGNVAIGTFTPSARLHVVGTQPASVSGNGTAATQVLQITGAKGGNTSGASGQLGGAGASVTITAGAGGNAPAGSTNGDGGHITLNPGAAGNGAGAAGLVGTVRLAPTGGNVGIGTTTPSEKLHVVGNILATGTITPSARRLKTNIQPLAGALHKIERLRGVSYDRKADGKHDIGLIAEEVGQVVPEVVAYEQNGVDAKGVDYARLTALLIEAVKEQQEQIRQLRAQVQQLQSRRSGEVARARR